MITLNKICPNCNHNFSMEFDTCVYCGTPLIEQEKLNEADDSSTKNISAMTDQEILDTYKDYKERLIQQGVVKNDADFIRGIRQNNYDKRILQMGYEIAKTKHNEGNVPKCPTCGSTHVYKISTTAKAANIVLFGVFGTKRYKTFHCDNCGYEW